MPNSHTTPINQKLDLVMDLEVNRLPSGPQFIPKKNLRDHSVITNLDNLDPQHIVPSEIALLDTSSGKTTAFVVNEPHSPKEVDFTILSTHDGRKVFNGSKQKVKIHAVQMQGREDIERVLSGINSKGKKLSDEQKQFFREKVSPNINKRGEIMYEIVVGKQKFYFSNFSSKFYKKTAQETMTNIINVNQGHAIIDNAKSGTILYSEIQDKFVNEFAQFIINSVNTNGTVNIGAWNAQFEAKRMAELIYNFADPKLKEAYFDLLKSEKIKYIGAEGNYLDVMYGLFKDDKSSMSSFTIPMREDTFLEFGYRAGNTPKTFEEFITAIPQAQELMFSEMKEFLPQFSSIAMSDLHSAVMDTDVTKNIHQFFGEVKERTIELARAARKNVNGKDWLEALDAQGTDARGFIKQAFEDVLGKKEWGSHSSVSANKSATKFIEAIKQIGSKRSQNTKELMKIIGGKVDDLGGGPGRTISSWFKSKSISNKGLKSIGILGGLGLLALGSTYLETNDKDYGYSDSFGKLTRSKAYGLQFDDDYDDNGPYIHRRIGKLFGAATGTAAVLAAIGYREGINRGRLLGVWKDFSFAAEGFTGTAKHIGKLIKTGTHVTESFFPISRVFKAGSAISFLEDIHSTKSATHRVPLWDVKNSGRVGTSNMDSYLNTLKEVNPLQYDMIMQEMASDNSQLSKSSLIIKRGADKKVSIMMETVDLDGNIRGFGNVIGANGLETDVVPNFIRTSRANLSAREVHPSERMMDSRNNRLRSTLAEDYLSAEQTRLGLIKGRSFKEYLSHFKKPDFLNADLHKGWRWLQYQLEIGPKGVHLGEDLFNNRINQLGKVKTVVGIQSINSKGFWLEEVKERMKQYGQFGLEYLEAGNRFLESPFQVFVDPTYIQRAVRSLKGSHSKVKQFAGSVLQKIESPHLGLNISTMKYGAPEYLAKFALKRVLPVGLAYYGLKTIDSLLGAATFSDSDRGPVSGLFSNVYKSAVLGYTALSDITGLTSLAKKQEKIAPGSTGLGFFAFPAMVAGSFGIAQAIHDKLPMNMQRSINAFGNIALTGLAPAQRYDSLAASLLKKINGNSYVKEALVREAFSGSMNKSFGAKVVSSFIKRPKLTLFAAATTLLAPFIPGAIGSTKTFSERRAEFNGEKDVAIRKNRGWLLGSTAFTGQGVQQFRQHGLHLSESNWENIGVVWPSYWSRMLHAATLGMANRYVLEDYHREAQPVYETSPYGAGIPVIGPLISKSIGWLVKPVKRMHEEYNAVSINSLNSQDYSPRYRNIIHKTYAGLKDNGSTQSFNILENNLTGSLKDGTGIKSLGSFEQSGAQFMNQLNDVVGFKGFAVETVMGELTGKVRPDEFTPYLKSAQEMYNPSQYMWQYQSGDFSLLGGEFLRRGFVDPRHKWEINNIPNELSGQNWIPKRLQQGTTFDSMPMGWLYASRKGWEFQYPEIANKPMEEYPDHIKLDILKYMAPKSQEFAKQLQAATKSSINDELTPFAEQRVYDAADQQNEMQKRINVRKREYQYELDMETIKGRVTSLNPNTLSFTVDGYGEKEFQLAGVSTSESHIRAGLLKSKDYSSTDDLARDAREIQERLLSKVNERLKVGTDIEMNIPSNGSFSGTRTEAIVGNLNADMLSSGSPLLDTGNVSQYNLTQDQGSVGDEALSRYWDALTDNNSFFSNRLLGNKDYIRKYKGERVYNMQVKLWQKPIEHYVQPAIASILDNFGISMTPSFTRERRKEEQYWDILKYIKYKTLSTKASYSGNSEDAAYYQEMADKTMVGADPTNNSEHSLVEAMPYGDKSYFNYFANEPDSKRRGEIMNMISAPQRRIFNALWLSKIVKSGKATQEQIEQYDMMKGSGGYAVDKSMVKEWKNDTGEQTSFKDYVRSRYIAEYAKHNNIPGPEWPGWSESAEADNIQIHYLQEEGYQTQDYGYFDEHRRSAAYDKMAYIASQQMTSTRLNSSDFIGTVAPMLNSNSGITSTYALPTGSKYGITGSHIELDEPIRSAYASNTLPSYANNPITASFLSLPRRMY
jgi:hypothetical protein